MGFLSSVGKAIGGIISNPILGASLITDSFSGKKQQEDANKMAMKAWNIMNDYNHPAQQMERLKEAGLNPLLVYGSGSVTGNTTGSPALSGGGISTKAESVFKGLSNVLSVMQGQANIDNTHAQTSASNAAAGASTAQASNLNQQAAINEKKAEYEEKNQIADLEYKRAMTAKVKNDTRVSAATADMTEAEAKIFGSAGGSKGITTGAKILRGFRGIFK